MYSITCCCRTYTVYSVCPVRDILTTSQTFLHTTGFYYFYISFIYFRCMQQNNDPKHTPVVSDLFKKRKKRRQVKSQGLVIVTTTVTWPDLDRASLGWTKQKDQAVFNIPCQKKDSDLLCCYEYWRRWCLWIKCVTKPLKRWIFNIISKYK